MLLLQLAILPSFLKAQSIADLDKRNGFGKITFESTLKDLKKVASLKEISSSKKTNEVFYKVKNIEDFNIYGHPLQYITLSFYKDMLYQIEIKLQAITDMPRSVSIRYDILKQVWRSYGNETSIDTNFNTKTLRNASYRYWRGRDVTLIQEMPERNAVSVMGGAPDYSVFWVGDTWYFVHNGVYNLKQQSSQVQKLWITFTATAILLFYPLLT